jgi:hypothetical protein
MPMNFHSLNSKWSSTVQLCYILIKDILSDMQLEPASGIKMDVREHNKCDSVL